MATSQKNTFCFGNTQSRTFRGRCRTELSASSQAFSPKNSSSSSWTTVKTVKRRRRRQHPSEVEKVEKFKNTNPKARLCHFHCDPRKTCRKGDSCRFAHTKEVQEEAIQKFNDFKARAMKKAEKKDMKRASKAASIVAQKAGLVAKSILKRIIETEMADLDIIDPKKTTTVEQKPKTLKRKRKQKQVNSYKVGLPGRIEGLKAAQKEQNTKNWQEKEKLRKELGLKTMKWSRYNRWKRKQPKKKKEEKKVEVKKVEKKEIQQEIPTEKDFTVKSEVKACEVRKVEMTKWTEMAKKEKKEEEKKKKEPTEEKKDMKECWEKDQKYTRYTRQGKEEEDYEDSEDSEDSEEDFEEEYEGTDAW